MKQTPDEIHLSASEYYDLLETQRWLDTLMEAGIDNTEAYDYACQLRNEREGIAA